MVTKSLCLVFALFCAVNATPQNRITGGTPIAIEDAPYVSALVYYYPRPSITIQRCTGAIISSFHVVTTAFCFTGAVLENMDIRVGSTNSLEGGITTKIAEVVKHPDYVQDPRTADIALVTVVDTLYITESVNTLYLPRAGLVTPDGSSADVTGWGFDSIDGNTQLSTLNTISLTTVPLADCKESFADDDVTINEAVICAKAEGQGTCRGDSGAPLVSNGIVLGISSIQECAGGKPDVFTSIATYTNWILEAATPRLRSGGVINVADVI